MASHSSMLALFGVLGRPDAAKKFGQNDVVDAQSPEPSLTNRSSSSVPPETSIDTPVTADGLAPASVPVTGTTTPSCVDPLSLPDPLAAMPASSDVESTRLEIKMEQAKKSTRQPDQHVANTLRRQSSRLSAKFGQTPKREPTKSKRPPGASQRDHTPSLRDSIMADFTNRRKLFLLAHKDRFLSVLPKVNHFRVLEAQTNFGGQAVVPYTELQAQPAGIKATLKGYQLQGLSFLLHLYSNGMSGILGDEMGLGKTLQTLSLFQHLYDDDISRGALHNPKTHRPFLVVCPLSVLNSWASESEKWAPKLKAVRFHGPKDERTILKRELSRFDCQCAFSPPKMGSGKQCPPDIIVTTYETLSSEHVWLKRAFHWRCVVLDEGHKIKNHKSQVSKSLMGLKCELRLILTGTPLQNNLVEMWSLLHWMFPELFSAQSADQFKTAFDLSRGSVDISFMDNAKTLLELVMLRRLKDSPGVNLGLPPKEEIVLYLPLTPMQQFWYKELLTRSGNSLLEGIFKNSRGKEQASKQTVGEWDETEAILRKSVATMTAGKSTRQRLLNLLMQLRKCCGHPYLLPMAQPDPYHIGEHIVRASSKFIVLKKLLQDICVDRKEKVLIFSGFVTVLNYVEDMLDFLSRSGMPIRPLRIDGSTARARRNLNIRLFNNSELDYNVMLISTKAGGLGITLTAATSVIFLDEEWNPQLTRQAEARAHRIGQTKKVTIYKMSTQGTVEEQMLGRIRKKLYLSAKITENLPTSYSANLDSQTTHHLESDNDMVQLSSNELMNLIRRGAKTLSNDEVNVTELLSWDLPKILEKCREKDVDATTAPPAETADEEEKWLQTMEKVETAVFNGLPVANEVSPKKARAMAKMETKMASRFEIISLDPAEKAARREAKKATVMIDGYQVDKSTVGCSQWEAVATTAKDRPGHQAGDLKRERRQFERQSHCQDCYKSITPSEAERVECTFCPRIYHYDCMPARFQKTYLKSITFSCPQHKCHNCKKSTEQVGGMLFRCRWCPMASCEDCIDFDEVKLVGDFIDEMTGYGYMSVPQLFWIECCSCVSRLSTDRKFISRVADWKEAGRKMKDKVVAEWNLQNSLSDPESTESDKFKVEDVTGPIVLDDSTDLSTITPVIISSRQSISSFDVEVDSKEQSQPSPIDLTLLTPNLSIDQINRKRKIDETYDTETSQPDGTSQEQSESGSLFQPESDRERCRLPTSAIPGSPMKRRRISQI